VVGSAMARRTSNEGDADAVTSPEARRNSLPSLERLSQHP
jgi:hypothetical protein